MPHTTSFPEALAALRARFLEQLPGRLQEMGVRLDHLDAADARATAESLRQLVHQLKGAAGTFGFAALSEQARLLELALGEWADAPAEALHRQLLAAFAQLAELAARAGQTPEGLPVPAQPERAAGRLLIWLLADDASHRAACETRLAAEGLQVRSFADSESLLAAWRDPGQPRPDALVMDLTLAGDALGGVRLLETLKASGALVPTVVLSARTDLEAHLSALRAGACRYLTKPVTPGRVADVLRAVTGVAPQQPYRVLLVDDDPLLLEYQATILREAGLEVEALAEPLRLFEVLERFQPDVLVLDVYMPGASGPELAAVLRERDDDLTLPILFLSAETDPAQQVSALFRGGDDFLVKPVDPEHLVAAVTARARRVRQIRAIQKRLEASLYEREREHLALNQHAIVSVADRRGIIVYVNDRFCEVSGYSRGELLGQNHRIVKSGWHEPAFYRDLWATISSGRVWQGEICNRRKDGSFYWVLSTIVPFLDETGKPYQYVSIRTDITRLKETERDLEAHKERLRRGQVYANIGTWDWNIQTGELFWTERIAPLFGYPEGELETTYENFLAAVHPEDRQRVIDAVNAAVERDEPYEIEHRVVWPDGTVRWLLERGAVLRAEDGTPLQMLGVVQDIHDRKQAELALVAAREEAEQASRAKSEFLSSMSHELRTPMNAVLGFAQLLAYDPSTTPEQKEMVDEILKAGHHLLELINEVLDLSRIEAGRIDLSIEAVGVAEVLDEAIRFITPLAAARDIAVACQEAGTRVVRADRTRLKQALLNLLSNAVKYNRPGGQVAVRIEEPETDWVRLAVADTGPGIAPEKLGELFEPFNRLGAEATEVEGTGIGLAITRRLVEVMGGRVGVASQVGEGSVFWIDLRRESEAAVTTGDSDRGETVTPTGGRAHTVLYVEDNPSNIRLVSQILARHPHLHLLTAHTPELGIETARVRRPDLIILDITMPGMNGYEVLSVLKGDPLTRDIPVMALTANAMPRDVERGRQAGFADYLTKPIDVPRFLAAIDRLLDKGAP